MSTPVMTPPRRIAAADLVGTGVALLLLLGGLAWAKWLPYGERVVSLRDLPVWPSGVIFDAAGGGPSFAGAWEFTVAYLTAVWRAVVVALLVAAAVDALVPRRWLVRALNRRSPLRQAVAGGVASMPSMMCSCCTAPVAVSLRRGGVSTGAALAYWVGNPLLNPAVLVFLALVLPWEYAATRVLVGVLVAIGASALIGRFLGARAEVELPELAPPPVASLPGRFLRSLTRFAVVLVPEYVALVFLMGLLSPWLSGFEGVEASLGAAAVLVAAVVGTMLVIPTGGEIPVVAALLAVGAGSGTVGALLITLPALSVPSVAMVGSALGWRATTAMTAAVAVGGVLGGLVLIGLV